MLLIAGFFLQCRDVGTGSPLDDSQPTRLYLTGDTTLSTSPHIAFSPIKQGIDDCADYTAVLACDMVGTKCEFGIVLAARPEEQVVAKAEIIICKEGVETVITSKIFDVNSRTYTRYLETIEIEDPDCSCNNFLILRISKKPGGSAPLHVGIGRDEPFNSYIEVPRTKITE